MIKSKFLIIFILLFIGFLIVGHFLAKKEQVRISNINVESPCTVSFEAENLTQRSLKVNLLVHFIRPITDGSNQVADTPIIGSKPVVVALSPKQKRSFEENITILGSRCIGLMPEVIVVSVE